MKSILEGYADAATPSFIAAYDQLSPEVIYEHVLDLLPTKICRIADIGAGTGRDAAWFAARGHEVVAVEPVCELREAGQILHVSDRITWLDDQLPDLAELRPDQSFDLVMLCAVWQHITEHDRALALPRLASLLVPSGRLIMSLRHGPGGKGRPVFPVSVDATIKTAEDCKLQLLRRLEADSVQEGNKALGVYWTWLALENVR